MYHLINKRCIFFNVLTSLLFANSPTTEVYAVVNNSEETIKITAQFKNGIAIFSTVEYYKDGKFIHNFKFFRPFFSEKYIVQSGETDSVIEFYKDNDIDIGILEKLNYLEALKTEISTLKDGSRALTLLSEQLLTSNDNLRQFNEQIGSRMQERDEDLAQAYEDIEKLEKQKLRLIIAVVVIAAVIVSLGFFGFKFLARMFSF